MLFKKNNRVKNFKEKNIQWNSVIKKRKFLVKQNLKKIFWWIIFLFFWWIIFFIFFSNYFSVSEISFERKNFSFNPETISKDLEKEIWKNIFFINTFSIEKELKKENPQFKDIKVKKIFPDTIYFEVSDFKNIFEIDTFFTKKNKDTWVLEKFLQKFLISQSWQLKNFPIQSWTWSKNSLKKIFIKEDSWKKLEIWKNFISWEILSKIQKINSYLETQEKIKVDEIFYWPNWKEIHFNTKNWNFYFTLSKNIDKQIQKILYFKESKNLNNLEKKEFEYLDLRISDKIIYK